MANVVFNIVELTRQVFGIGGFIAPAASLPRNVQFEDVEVVESLGVYPKSSLLNSDILDTVYFKEGNETIYHLNSAPIINLRRPKRIVRSQVRRRAGSVKELISLGDWVGTIKGVLVNNDSNDPPYEQMAELKKLDDKTKEWEVESDLFTELDIFNIVVTDVQFVGAPGMQNYQPFILSFESDEPIILEV